MAKICKVTQGPYSGGAVFSHFNANALHADMTAERQVTNTNNV